MMMKRSLCLPYFAVYLLTVSCNADRRLSPIEYLEPSLAASVAHSTTAAICHEDCVIILTRSSRPKTSALVIGTEDDNEESTVFEKYGIKLRAMSSSSSSSSSSWRRAVLLSNQCVCSMTGFAPDIVHLQKVVEKSVENYRALYSMNQPFRATVTKLASTFQETAFQSGTRPYGVEALLVGLNESTPKRWVLCVCDPTGTIRYYHGGITCIGRHAAAVRKEMATRRGQQQQETATAELQVAVGSLVKAFEKAREIDDHTLEGTLVWRLNNGKVRAARIDSSFLKALEIATTEDEDEDEDEDEKEQESSSSDP